MSVFSRWFGSKSGKSAGGSGWEKQAARLEREAEEAQFGFKGTPLNRAGDLALKGGAPEAALGYYGRAIDAFLEAEQREAARGVANKIIRVHPGAVRTLCTLTWLDLAARHMATALLHLRDYVVAAEGVGQGTLAGVQIYRMAKLSAEPEFLDAAADALDRLALASQAEEVRGWTAAGGSENSISDPHALAEACLRAASRSNEGASPDADADW